MKVMNIGGDLDSESVSFEWFSTKREDGIADRMNNLNRIFNINPDEIPFLETGCKGHSLGTLFGTDLKIGYCDFQRGLSLGERKSWLEDEEDLSTGDRYHQVEICTASGGSSLSLNANLLNRLKEHPYVREVADIFSATKRLDNLSLENIRAYLKNQERMYSAEYTVEDFSGA